MSWNNNTEKSFEMQREFDKCTIFKLTTCLFKKYWFSRRLLIKSRSEEVRCLVQIYFTMAKRKKGICRGRVCLVVFLVFLAGTSLLNVMFILQTTSRTTSAEKEPMEYDIRFHSLTTNSVSSSVNWTKERKPSSSTGTAGKSIVSNKILTCIWGDWVSAVRFF